VKLSIKARGVCQVCPGMSGSLAEQQQLLPDSAVPLAAVADEVRALRVAWLVRAASGERDDVVEHRRERVRGDRVSRGRLAAQLAYPAVSLEDLPANNGPDIRAVLTSASPILGIPALASGRAVQGDADLVVRAEGSAAAQAVALHEKPRRCYALPCRVTLREPAPASDWLFIKHCRQLTVKSDFGAPLCCALW